MRRRTPPASKETPPGGHFVHRGYTVIRSLSQDHEWYVVKDKTNIGTARTAEGAREMIDSLLPNPGRSRTRAPSKTVDVSLPMSRAAATEWLRKHVIPFTHMREQSGGGVAFRIRRGYVGDFYHQRRRPNTRLKVKRPGRPRITARGRRRNPLPRGREVSRNLVVSATVKKSGGYVEKINYEDLHDGQHYYHDFDDLQAILYLVDTAAFGKCLLIVSADEKPLWEDA